MKIFESARKPLIILGAGIHQAQAEHLALNFVRLLKIPVVCTWGAIDLFHHDDPLYFGGFGTHGNRYSNFAVQNADVILTIGTKLDTKATGSPAKDFAPKAKVYMVDIDESEINKFKRLGREIEGINEDLTDFLWRNLPKKDYEWELYPSDKDNSGWIAKLTEWKKKYPSGMEAGGQNPYTFIEQLGDKLRSDDVLVSDTGCSLGWMCQVFKFKGQRLLHAWNNTPMGYGLPASIGASFATGKRIILITGDGGLGVNITEFATVARHQLNIKTILFNNYGHQMCRQTQRTWMGGEYPSTSYEGGLATPDFESIAHAYTIPVYKRVEDMLFQYGPGFYEFKIYRENEYQLSPQVQFGRALDDPHPLLPRKELEEIRNV